MTVFARCLLSLAALTGVLAHAEDYSDISLLLRDGKLADARARVEQQLGAKPRDPQLRLYKGVIQRESGRTSEAIATFSKLSEDHPDLPEPYNNLAAIYAAQGQYDKARVALEQALRTNPSYATAHDNLADIYARLASQAYSRALQIDPSTPAPAQLALLPDLVSSPGSQLKRQVIVLKPTTAKPITTSSPASNSTQTAAGKPTAPNAAASASAAPETSARPAPGAIASSATPALANPHRLEVEQAVQAWARAWAEKNMTQYLAAYGKDFEPPGRLTRSAWEQERRARIVGKSKISVGLRDMDITVKGNHAVAKFRQDYKADALTVSSRKTLELTQSGERWLIDKEISGR